MESIESYDHGMANQLHDYRSRKQFSAIQNGSRDLECSTGNLLKHGEHINISRVFLFSCLISSREISMLLNTTIHCQGIGSILTCVETKRRRVGGINSLNSPLIHHTYIYKKVRLYIRQAKLFFLIGYNSTSKVSYM